MTTPNAELAYKVLDKAEAHANHFRMAEWGWSPSGQAVRLEDLTSPVCGTTACLAGWTVAMAGYRVDSSATVYDTKGKRLGRKADDMAAEMLGITPEQRDDLFYCTDDSIADRVADIFGPRPAVTA